MIGDRTSPTKKAAMPRKRPGTLRRVHAPKAAWHDVPHVPGLDSLSQYEVSTIELRTAHDWARQGLWPGAVAEALLHHPSGENTDEADQRARPRVPPTNRPRPSPIVRTAVVGSAMPVVGGERHHAGDKDQTRRTRADSAFSAACEIYVCQGSFC